LQYIVNALTAELSLRIDERPRIHAELSARRAETIQRIQRLIEAIEEGAPQRLSRQPLAGRQAELEGLDAEIGQLDDGPLGQRLAVIPAWVERQLQDLANLFSDTPERTKHQFLALGLSVTFEPIYAAPRPFYRTFAKASLAALTDTNDLSRPTTDRLHRK
jgi:hypothetical protein